MSAREEGADIFVMARTDALGTDGLEQALARAKDFADVGADKLFVETPTSEQETQEICRRVPGHHLANMLEEGAIPILSDARLHEIGFKLVAHPFTVFGASVSAMKEALRALREGRSPKEDVSFGELRRIVGFEDYHREEERYRRDSASS